MQKISNTVVFAIIGAFFAMAFTTEMPTTEILWRVQLSLAVLGLGFAAYRFYGVGAGVTKLVPTAFLWLGLEGGALFFCVSLGLPGPMAPLRNPLPDAVPCLTYPSPF